MWQEVAIIFIGIFTIIIVGYKIYQILLYKKNIGNKCINCSGCSLKNKDIHYSKRINNQHLKA
ncbi:FeoB-associated Cys-rich membrane protein [Parabacteroides goldsteinii]|uniref:FeoB-associated Cys-rich membrane protein n=3 Tax=Parabacteroides goldsteinii TaxID=328812 RepID=A0A6G1ZII0_9BACT|nr:hypothetical protein C803_00018 [Parabacteroides goldsteinii dnLKV18]KAI4360335.1 hypothetical protein C825_002392 [Parabacteroides sp. ASF519]MRX93925.1 FeoB-associated Cys-rich membrane protein [Parabacteroides goldsteinii]TFU69592.1 FeoB-associated Cys-rich membrane protein [Parabacteroides sp. P14]MRX99225.1 FeoB-associated Cys-rich membrane protein [Parabacteroides goldsteinii]